MRKVKILNVVWHSVEPDTINPDFLAGWNPTASLFREQIRFLVNAYTPISVREFLEITASPSLIGSYRKPPVLLSFDDGFRNVVDQALPVLNEFGIPALFFVIGEIVRTPDFVPWYVERTHLLRKTPRKSVIYGGASLDLTSRPGRGRLTHLFGVSLTACPDQERPKLLDDLAELLDVKRPKAGDLDDDLRFLTADDLAKLGASSLLTIGSHALTHRFLDSLTYQEQFHELQQSHALLSSCSPSYFPALSYPGGAFNADTVAIAKQIYKCAFATLAIAFRASYRNTYIYPRVMIGQDTIQSLAYQVSRRRLTYFLPFRHFLHDTRIWRSA